jgi:uncharacterized protein DUF2442
MPGETATQEDSTSGVTPKAPWRVKAVSVLPEFRLAVTFRDGTNGIVDLSSVRTASKAGVYAALADIQLFEKAYVDLGVVTWPNGADLDPAWMYEQIKEKKVWSVPI